MIMMTIISLTTLITFLYKTTPLTMAATVAIQSILIALMTTLITKMSWFAFVLLMVFLSGMMIIFTYISSLASNEFITLPVWLTPPMMIMMITVLVMLMLTQYENPLMTQTNLMKHSMTMSNTLSTHYVYISHSSFITIFLISYLFITLLVVVKNSALFKGPLRNLN